MPPPTQVTDGFENSSREWTRQSIAELIERCKQHGWTFIFLAANQDAIQTGASLGFAAGSCATFAATPAGAGGLFGSAAASVCRAVTFGSDAAAFTAQERAACLGEGFAPHSGASHGIQGGLFGGGVFGGTSTPAVGGGGLFGGAPLPGGGGLFGGAPAPAGGGGGLFGGAPTPPAPAAHLLRWPGS